MIIASMWRILSLFLVISASISLNAQVTDYNEKRGSGDVSDGTDYYIGLPACQKYPADILTGGQNAYELWISSKVNTVVTLKAEGVGYETTIALSANTVKIVNLPSELVNDQSEVARPHGVRLFASDPFSVTVANNWRSSGAVYKALPVELWGKSYRTLNNFQDRDDAMHPGQILIMAAYDDTKVTIKARARTEKGVGTVVLNKGEVFLVLAEIDSLYHHNSKGDLSGSLVESNKPIGVVSGHTKGAFPRFEETFHGIRTDMLRNAYVEMLMPTTASGTEFMSAPRKLTPNRKFTGPQEEGELIRFVATEDGTIVSQMRQDGTGLKQLNVPMKAGEYFDILSLVDPGYYKSNKPIIVGQYMKAWLQHFYEADKGESPLGHVFAGNGELTTLTPLHAWPSSAVFYSPPENNNYVYVTFRTEDVGKLQIDGKLFQTFFGSSIKEYKGTPYSFANKEVGIGSHIIEGAQFAAYSYGHWDDPSGGFKNYAYAYPVAVNASMPCEDSVLISGDPKCGIINGMAGVLPAESECAALLNIRLDLQKSSNMKLTLPDDNVLGLKESTFLLSVIDMSKPATGIIRATTRSGKFVERTYTYTPEELSADPLSVNYGMVGVGDTVKQLITLTNPSKTQTTVIKKLKLKYDSKEFLLPTGIFPITLAPQASRTIDVPATSLEVKSGVIVDSLIAELECRDVSLTELRLLPIKPQVYTGDADFGKVPVNSERKLDVLIRNTRKVDIVVTGINWPDADKQYFPRVEGLIENFPLTIKANGEFPFKVVFTPGASANVQRETRAMLTCNTDDIKIYSDWKGMAVEAGPILNGYDWKERRVLDDFVAPSTKANGYQATIEYGNSGSTPLTDIVMTISGSDGSYFTVPTNQVANRLGENEFKSLDVNFMPEWVKGSRAGERPYELTLTLTGKDNGMDKSVSATLKGIGIQPHIAMTPSIDFGTVLPSANKSLNAEITSNGTMDLTLMNTKGGITIIGPDASKFTIDPAFFVNAGAYPLTIVKENGANVLSLPIIFTAGTVTAPTTFNATVVLESDAPETVQTELKAYVEPQGSPKGEPTDITLKQFITLKKTGQVELKNIGDAPMIVTSLGNPQGNGAFVWKAASTMPLPATIAPGSALKVDVTFSPSMIRTDVNNAILQDIATISYTTNAGDYTSTLTGIPDEIVSLVRVGSESYTVKPGGISDWLTLELSDKEASIARLENLDRAEVRNFQATINYNPTVAEPLLGVDDLLVGSMTSNWKINSAQIVKPGEFVVRMSGPTQLSGTGTLFKFKMKGYLDTNKNTPLGSNLTILNDNGDKDMVKLGYTRIENRPGKIALIFDCAGNIRGVRFATGQYALKGSYPNPSSGKVTIPFSTGLDGHAKIGIYNTLGHCVAVLLNDEIKAGEYALDVDLSDLNIASGAYILRLETAKYIQTEQIMLSE
ncbi:MAG: T9SS C-terminal target domain-containing protein [Bacteroidetes bacterium]|nr:T9SS C-terminal target domain-containing protein [bacterium]NBP64071.1 T9SS C-terminal target domain-containing protein [Bacteroidota bacterium]